MITLHVKREKGIKKKKREREKRKREKESAEALLPDDEENRILNVPSSY